MKKIWVFITTCLLSFSLVIPCYAEEVNINEIPDQVDPQFYDSETYDYYREQIPDYITSFNYEFAQWYVENHTDSETNIKYEEEPETYISEEEDYSQDVDNQYTEENYIEEEQQIEKKDIEDSFKYFAKNSVISLILGIMRLI